MSDVNGLRLRTRAAQHDVIKVGGAMIQCGLRAEATCTYSTCTLLADAGCESDAWLYLRPALPSLLRNVIVVISVTDVNRINPRQPYNCHHMTRCIYTVFQKSRTPVLILR